ncbi:MAG: phosphotransferase [Candidatus Microbacterium phytovorans]|uniref:Maltokinase n=1 Tax=Candidatus Microbacterium phytovorans TaxID=3121374 RepID=A0AAJ5W496_9MICO|nr:phosphotransferase [Microbacterium sp.]WEK14654.1 MAG: phosphotransferase [Microbacterium sp.]
MDSTLACLVEWMPRQRWYSSKGRSPLLRLLTTHEWPSDDPSARVRTLIVADEGAAVTVVYQVPLVLRTVPPSDAAAIVGTTEDGIVLIDGPRDVAYTAALWRALDATRGESTSAADPHAPVPRARVLTGEQSNTSVIFELEGAPPVICKVFRQLHPGINPDIELQTALAESGSRHVPRARGAVAASWASPDGSGPTEGSLAFAQEFLPDVADAWRVARQAAESGESFAASAHALGAATADVHLSLARVLPTAAADPQAREAIGAAWRRRLDIATSEVPALTRHRDTIAAVYARAHDAVWEPLQRIHGDYHLGQVLHAQGRGWILLDFEGEPMRPMSERRRPDSPLRDIAGMLRSFDYVAGSLSTGGGTPPPNPAWAEEARRAFLSGYEARSGHPATGPLLDAFELDKAVYEAIYESRNRPEWLDIPLAAIDRLVARGATVSPPATSE